MGREVRRVPMDFDWPLNKTWEGFLCPHYEKCKPCDGRGSTTAADRLNDIVGLLMISGDDSRPNRGKAHPYFQFMPHTPGMVPSPDMGELTDGLAGRDGDRIFGHDALDRWSAIKKIRQAAGVPDGWGVCEVCAGEGMPPEIAALAEAWEPTDPPTGDGWQMWETTSEGSPISPVFAAPEELARWLADNGASTFGSDTTTYEKWLGMIENSGYAFTFGISNGVMKSGVDMAAETDK